MKTTIKKMMFVFLSFWCVPVSNTLHASTATVHSSNIVPLTINIHPLGIFFGTAKADLNLGVSDNLAIGLLGSYSEETFRSEGVRGASFGLNSTYFLSGQRFDSFYIKPEYEWGYLKGKIDRNEGQESKNGSLNYNMVKLITGYHWLWDNGVNLKLGGGAAYIFGNTNINEDSHVRIGNFKTKLASGHAAGILPVVELTLGYSVL